jgi:Protein of unknown function (DUF1501)
MDHGREHACFATRFVSRRALLRAGGYGLLGLGWPGLRQLPAAQPSVSGGERVKSCILIFYYGGPSHLDTWDMKPNAPAEIRGEFRPIATRVPGISVCEHLPRSARMVDKLAVVRSMHHPMRNHNSAAVESLCGRTPLNGDLELLSDDRNSFPCYGAVLSQQRHWPGDVPAHVALPHVMYNVVQLPGQTAGFLGAAYNPFQIQRDPSAVEFPVDGLELPADVPLERMDSRRSLLHWLDSRTRSRARMRDMTVQHDTAFRLVGSERLRRAFDLSHEDERLRLRYGRNRLGQSLLLARRLVEAGVPFINVNDKVSNGQLANWDSHENNFGRLKNDLLPPADQGFSALIEDLEVRGLLESTLVIALAEFGRTPRINTHAGRDHWPDCFSVLLAGGGIQGGRVHGSSDRSGAFPASDPVSPGDLAATIFWRFGLDTHAEMHDLTGRPYRLADGEALRKLFY